MTTKQALDRVIQELPEDRLSEVLEFAHFVRTREECHEWSHFGKLQLARAYGNDEPEYTEADIKPELEP